MQYTSKQSFHLSYVAFRKGYGGNGTMSQKKGNALCKSTFVLIGQKEVTKEYGNGDSCEIHFNTLSNINKPYCENETRGLDTTKTCN